MKGKIKPPVIYQLFMLNMIFFLLPGTRLIGYPASFFGVPIFLFSAHMAFAAKKEFKATDTPMKPSKSAGKLERDGYFRFSRNPMCLGITIGLIGFSILLNSYINFLFLALFLIAMDIFYVSSEEDIRSRAFGQ